MTASSVRISFGLDGCSERPAVPAVDRPLTAADDPPLVVGWAGEPESLNEAEPAETVEVGAAEAATGDAMGGRAGDGTGVADGGT